jgi:hypothetical protein
MIIFNWIGVGMGIGAALVAAVLAKVLELVIGHPGPDGTNLLIGGVAAIGIDLGYRLTQNPPEAGLLRVYHPKAGGAFFWIPVWVVALWFGYDGANTILNPPQPLEVVSKSGISSITLPVGWEQEEGREFADIQASHNLS